MCVWERWKEVFWRRVGRGVQAAASLWGAYPHSESKILSFLRLSWQRFGLFIVVGLSPQCPSDTDKTINLLCSEKKNISNPLFHFFCFVSLVSFPGPLWSLTHILLQCGCSGSFPGKPVDYPNCFMAKSYPTITVLFHWETHIPKHAPLDTPQFTPLLHKGWQEYTCASNSCEIPNIGKVS